MPADGRLRRAAPAITNDAGRTPDMAQDDIIAGHLQRSLQALTRAVADAEFLAAVRAAADCVASAVRADHKVLLAGNGGSAADAQHVAAELVGRFRTNRAPFPAIALTTDSSTLTAISNDFGYEHVFARQVRALGQKGDVFIAISTSGRSPNILAALATAREIGLATIALTGAGATAMRVNSDVVVAVPSDDTPLIQQIHITAAHAICDHVERCLTAPREH
jgi:D-sedoheptulose 7-phosphate isomerase